MKPKKRTATTFIPVRQGKALMQHRTDDAPRYPGAWCFPGETPEFEESPMETVIRGLTEEYDLNVEFYDCEELTVYVHDDGEIDTVIVVQLPDDAEPKLREGKAFVWKSFAEVQQMKLGFEQEKLLPLLEE